MAINVEFLFDFGSPNAYLSHLVIPQIEARTGVTFRIRAGAARRRIQGDQQRIAGGVVAGHQEQTAVHAARNAAIPAENTTSPTTRRTRFSR